MIALLLALQTAAPAVAATSSAAPVLGAIGEQTLPASGCAAFLWSAAGDRTLVAMATAAPAQLRLAIDGATPADLARTGGEGTPSLGFTGKAAYQAGDTAVTLDMTVAIRPDLSAGAAVPQGVLTVVRPGRDTLLLPVAGLIGCASSAP